MGILRDFERRLEGAVEGFFARTFRSGLQPVELAKAVQRYASHYKQVDVDGVIVPNVYRIELSRSDAERFQGYGEALRHELAGVVHRTARERGWRLKGPVRIEVRIDEEIRSGTYELRGKIESGPRPDDRRQEAAPPPRPQPPAAAAATQVLESAGTGQATLRIVTGPGAGHDVRVATGAMLGRLPGCDVALDDPSVSRRHARLQRSAHGWTIQDLGSTNGVRINGQTVREGSLNDGDQIELGNVRLAFTTDGA